MNGIVWPVIDQYLIKFLEEDTHGWDLSGSLVPQKRVRAICKAKSPGILAGIDIFARIFTLLGVETTIKQNDGTILKPNDIVAEVSGEADKILIGERTSLNLLSRMSGIATRTQKFIHEIHDIAPNTKIAATRKTIPGLRVFDKIAVTVGGGDTHRFSLQDCIMLKDNHLALFDSYKTAIEHAKQMTSFSHKIEVECSSVAQALEALNAGADIIMLDNFSPSEAKKAIAELNNHPQRKNCTVEISGNVSLKNISEYAKAGPDIISTGKITHSVPAVDFSLKIKQILP